MTLTEFLLARYAEDEAAARDATSEPAYPHYGDTSAEETLAMALSEGCAEEGAAHFQRHTPERVLADIAAKRRIVEWCGEREQIHVGRIGSNPEAARPEDFVQGRAVRPAGSVVLRYLAAAYADHPDYRPEWAPESVSQP